MVNCRRLFPTIGFVVYQDVSPANRSDGRGKDDLVAYPTMEAVEVLPLNDLSRVRLGAVPKNENRRDSADRTELSPIRLSRLQKFAFDHVMADVDHRHLRNRAATP